MKKRKQKRRNYIYGILLAMVCLMASGCAASQTVEDDAASIEEEGQLPDFDAQLEEAKQEPQESTTSQESQKAQEPYEAQEPGTSQESQKPQDVEGIAALTEEEPPAREKYNDYYEELIAGAKEYLGRNDVEVPYDFCYVISMYGGEDLGYLVADIDGDGTDELIFGQSGSPSSAWDGVVYDIYTISNGELVHVRSGGERSVYYLCTNGMIANEGSSGAANSVYEYYSYAGAEMKLVESVIYDGWADAENPWFYSTQIYFDAETAEHISQEEALGVIDKYVYEHPVFIPFVEE